MACPQGLSRRRISGIRQVNRTAVFWGIAGLVSLLSGRAQAQLVAEDDTFSVPVAQQLVVETPGVLDNDSYNGEPAVDGGATAEFLARVNQLGYGSFKEGFEDDLAWGAARSPFTSPLVISQGIAWESNHPDPPAENEITTGEGPARTGLYGVFDQEHGYATGTPTQCDVDVPPAHCLFKDGFESGDTSAWLAK